MEEQNFRLQNTPAKAKFYRMSDNPKKKKADAKRQSQQKHEVAYRKSKESRNGKRR